MARDIEQIVRNHGWQPSGGDSLNDILSSAIAAGQLTKVNNTPQLLPGGGTLSKASKIVLMNPYYKVPKPDEYYYHRYKYKELWNELNFLDLDESLRMKLTDGDIAGVLTCIDAINHLKILRLPHCIKIRGDGLVPLRGSVVLQNVDLSIVPIEVNHTPSLSIDAILPTLESILEMNHNVLKNVHIPKVWRDSYNEKLYNFYIEKVLLQSVPWVVDLNCSLDEKRRRYLLKCPDAGNHMHAKKIECSECLPFFNSTYAYGVGGLNITCESDIPIEICPECGAKYCKAKPNSEDYSDHAEDQFSICDICQKKKCRACTNEIFHCHCCEKDMCDGGGCGDKLACAGDDCEEWDVTNCTDCAENDTNAPTKQCGQCHDAYCYICEPEMTHLGDIFCESCRG